MIQLESNKIKVCFESGSDKFFIKSIENSIAGEKVEFQTGGFAISIGENNSRIVSSTDMLYRGITYQDERKIVCEWHVSDYNLNIEYSYTMDDFVISSKVFVSNLGTQDVFIRDLIMFQASVEPHTNLVGETYKFQEKEQNTVDLSYTGQIDAQPVFIDSHIFLGIDWPVAQNVIYSGKILCRQLCSKAIKHGMVYETRTFSLGAGGKNSVSDAFLSHIDRIRGRKTRRASFYFDWLTHASEGLTEENMKKVLNYLQMLRKEYGIQFDIFAVDDGIVETRWGITFDRYRLQHESLFPKGIKSLTETAKNMGMGFGVWIGPDGFGDTEVSFFSRVDTVVKMVKDWNINLIKLDACVAPLLCADPYSNEAKMEKLEILVKKCREVNPALIVINHRISLSPYILTILDTTLWEGAEGYPELMLYNSTKPRLFTRYASYGRGKPVYYGTYSQLLEDHGVCFNGFHEGWAEEMVVQAFGRALMLSPEFYGALFLLPDSEYLELGRLMKLAAEKRSILSQTQYINETGDFLHSNGNQSIICMINDTWEVKERNVAVGPSIGIYSEDEEFIVLKHYPLHGAQAENAWRVKRNENITIMLGAFSTCLLEVLPADPCDYQDSTVLSHAIVTHKPERMDKAVVELGPFTHTACSSGDVERSEKVRFAISNDPIEIQQIKRLGQSKYEEVNECRRFFYDKVRNECCGIAENAWDNDQATAWGDAPYDRKTANIWRLDLGDYHQVEKIEIKLSHRWNGPVFEHENGRKLLEPVIFEASEDAVHWFQSTACIYYIRTAFIDGELPDKLIAEFDDLTKPVRYIRFHFHGVLVQDIKVLERKNGMLEEVGRSSWYGNNLFTARHPQAIFYKKWKVDEVWEGRYLAVIVRLQDNITIPARRENAVAWVESEDGDIMNIADASPAFPFHPWESQGDDFYTNSFTFRFALKEEMARKNLIVKLAWYGPEECPQNIKGSCQPEVTGCLVTVK